MAVSREVLEQFADEGAEHDAARPPDRGTPRPVLVPAPKPVTATRSESLLDEFAARALAIWPRLSRTSLAKAAGDPWRIARLVARRSSEPPEVIVAMLTGEPIVPRPSDAAGGEAVVRAEEDLDAAAGG